MARAMNHVQRVATVGASSERRCQRVRGLRWRKGLVDAGFGECGVEVGVAMDTDFILGRVRMGVEWHALRIAFAAVVRQF